MPIDLAGISNENEFYSNHYLTTAEDGPIKDRIDALGKDAAGVFETLAKTAGVWNRQSTAARADRSAAGRVTATREFADAFLRALGYDRIRESEKDAEDCPVPLLARVCNSDAEDTLWVIEAIIPIGEDFSENALGLPFLAEQLGGEEGPAPDPDRPVEQAIGKGIFNLDSPPRYLVVLSLAEAILIDRYKWTQGRLLRFDLEKILSRRDSHSLKVLGAILHKNSIVPHAGRSLLEEIDEESHRHAHGVSSALKGAIREAIELLGNEAARLIAEKRRKSKEGIFEGENALEARELTIQCIRYMYRLLFLFYVEARPDLGFSPMRSEAYRKGYSLEGLRELELVPLRTVADRDGHFIADRLQLLFEMTFHGTEALGLSASREANDGRAGKAFSMPTVRVELFDPDAISLLAGLKFRDDVMQKILRLLSLSDGKKGRRVGRISYAQLGVSQLGAVYETLLAFTGFFAATDLIEVRPIAKAKKASDEDASEDDADSETEADEDDAVTDYEDREPENASGSEGGDEGDPLKPAWFVPKARQGEFQPAEIVHDGIHPKVYRKGMFIYRLSGRDRQSSASYYTPEPLAKLLVKHALLELLPGKSADDILKLKVCEPAMGSAAFLVEVTNQLADAYLALKQQEVGKTIPQDRYAYERQKVRAYIADRNMFGVDLNPIAVELGQISLWLNCLHTDGCVPWFGDQLHAGNSLIGARRAAWPTAKLSAKSKKDLWHAAGTLPREIGWKGQRERSEVWQFLVPDPTMAEYPKYITELLDREALDSLAFWKNGEKAKKNSGDDDIPGFFDTYAKDEVETSLRLSKVVDQLFDRVARDLAKEREATNDEFAIWPEKTAPADSRGDFSAKRAHLNKLRGVGARNAPAWRRLKTAMDAWCALFFWPADKFNLLPSRADYLRDISLILEGGLGAPVQPAPRVPIGPRQGSLFHEELHPARPGSGALFEPVLAAPPEKDLFGEIDIDKLIDMSRWLPTAMEIAAAERFMHFDLEFADILTDRRGFDLIVGNPPWKKPEWRDREVLGSMDPVFALRGWTSKEISDKKEAFLSVSVSRYVDYLCLAASSAGMVKFTGAARTMPFVGSGQNNLYKCFVDLSWRIQSGKGIVALIHQDTHLLDPNGKAFRRSWYSRIDKSFSFRNALTSRMFSEVAHREVFSLNIYAAVKDSPCFSYVGGALLPGQVDDCLAHDGIGEAPCIKTSDGKWELKGHKKRVVNIDAASLSAMRDLIETRDTPPEESRFIPPFTIDTVEMFKELSSGTMSFSDGAGQIKMDSLWHETGAQKKEKVILKKVGFAVDGDIILTGPIFYVGNPLYKSPRKNASSKSDYDVIDLNRINDEYLPRTMYQRVVDKPTYISKSAPCKWDREHAHADFYRIAFRRRMRSQNERTLIGALIPPGFAHVHTVESLAFADETKLVESYPAWISLPFDFIVKSTGLIDFAESSLKNFPWVSSPKPAIFRALRLASLTKSYKPIWDRHCQEINDPLPWSSDDERLPAIIAEITWGASVPLKSDYSRRFALVEIDVIISIALGLKIEHLIDMYRIHFPVLKQNEDGTWFDQQGEIVWTCSKGLPGIGYLDSRGKSPPRKVWEADFANMKSGELTCEAITDFLPGGPHKVTRRFVAPFTKCDRVEDYRRAWAHFERLGVKPNKGV